MPQLLDQLISSGVVAHPFNEPSETELDLIRSKLEAVAPPFQLGTPQAPLWTSPLSIYYLEHLGQRFWLYDSQGFLCSTSSIEAVVILLMAEARPKPDPSRPAFHRGARELIFPGSAAQSETRIHQMQKLATERAREMRQRRSSGVPDNAQGLEDPASSYESGDDLLRTLGLDEG